MSGSAAPVPWRHLFKVTRSYLPLWAGCTILFTLAGFGYTNVRTEKYGASQALFVRNEANGEEDRLGKFASQTDLKSAQETILELARSREVVTDVFRQLKLDVTKKEKAELSKSINVRPPKGSEFGSTEVVYLVTEARTKELAVKFSNQLRESLTAALRNMRADRSSSVISELSKTRDLAKKRHDEAKEKLHKMETSVGSDLSELRALTESVSGSGESQRHLAGYIKDLQVAELELNKLIELENLLRRGQQDPDQLLVASSDLLTSQPTLKRLKDGFIDAQLAASRLRGLYTAEHPKMRAAATAQQEIVQKIHEELEASINSMEPQIRVAADRVERLKEKRDTLSTRMAQLAEMRTAYTNLIADYQLRSQLLERSETTLSEAEATREAALSTDLLTPMGPIQGTEKPVGPSNLMLVAASICAGLLCGFGMMFLVAPGPGQENFGRRWSDYSGSNFHPPEPPSGTSRAPFVVDVKSLEDRSFTIDSRKAETSHSATRPENDGYDEPVNQSPVVIDQGNVIKEQPDLDTTATDISQSAKDNDESPPAHLATEDAETKPEVNDAATAYKNLKALTEQLMKSETNDPPVDRRQNPR